VDDALHIPVITINDDVGKALLAGAGQSPGALQAAIDKALAPQSRALPGAQVTLHLENTVRSRGTTWNVAGLLQGSDPTLAPETVIISAHHDHDGSSGPDIWRRGRQRFGHGGRGGTGPRVRGQ
jgi:hypothetical protein